MKKENRIVGGGAKGEEESAMRITRARARTLGGVSASSRPPFKKKEQRNVALGQNSKRESALGSNKTFKSMVPLADVTNIPSCGNYIRVSTFQARGGYKKKNTKLASDVSKQVLSTREDVVEKLAEDSSTIEMVDSHNSDTNVAEGLVGIRDHLIADPLLSMQDSLKSDEVMCSPNRDIDMICEKLKASYGMGIVDIDSEIKYPLLWSSYAVDIYNNIRVAEHERRLSTDYMDTLQQDITPGMRGILVDWLVEVSEEYNLVPDTLYLTVNLIDQFLSASLIQKQRLQLLGVTCMLISSKYEEINAPRVEEFCFITDNTYTKAEVVKMESEVLKLLHFQLSIPTTKTFLRRFIQAAQSSYKVPYVELEFLANYLAELTLVEYSFLQFLPSMIAASAVLLARWTLIHFEDPWNPTMEHYTNYKVSELKTTVHALADLQLNTKGCSLNAVREKYMQQKFKCVANLPPKPVQSLFQIQV